MFVVSSMLMTAWIICIVLGFMLGGGIHVLAVAAVAIILASGNRREGALPA